MRRFDMILILDLRKFSIKKTLEVINFAIKTMEKKIFSTLFCYVYIMFINTKLVRTSTKKLTSFSLKNVQNKKVEVEKSD